MRKKNSTKSFADLVVDHILQGNTKLVVEVVEELLVEDEGHSRDLLHMALRLGVLVDEVGGDGDGQLAPELLALETLKKKNESIFSNNLKGFFSVKLHHVSNA